MKKKTNKILPKAQPGYSMVNSNPRPPRPDYQSLCKKTCAPGSELDLRRCICVQREQGPRDTTFNPETGRFDPNLSTKMQGPQPPMKKGGTVVKGGQLRRQASTKGLRTSKKH